MNNYWQKQQEEWEKQRQEEHERRYEESVKKMNKELNESWEKWNKDHEPKKGACSNVDCGVEERDEFFLHKINGKFFCGGCYSNIVYQKNKKILFGSPSLIKQNTAAK